MGAGRASGATATELERVAHSAAETGKVSVTAAREMEVAFLSTDKVGAQEMGRTIVENAGKIERLTQELQRPDAVFRTIETAVESALDRFADVLAQGKLDWKSWADAGCLALQDLNREDPNSRCSIR